MQTPIGNFAVDNPILKVLSLLFEKPFLSLTAQNRRKGCQCNTTF